MSQEGSTRLLPKYRRLTGSWRVVSVILPSIALTLSVLYVFNLQIFGWLMVDLTFLYWLIALFLPLCFLWIPPSKKASREKVPWYDMVLAALSLGAPFYFILHEYELLTFGWSMGAPTPAYICALILWPLVIEAGRRAAGPVFISVVFFFSVYPLFAEHMPGFLFGFSQSLHRLASFHVMGQDSIVGIPLHAFGRLFIGYMVYAIFLIMLGAGSFFNDIAMALVGKTRAGNAKVAIVSSGFFGSISGAPIANVMTTGSMTIPAMKKEGLPAEFAGAVEASASTGGALMPPVMGIVAFIMAEFLGVPYAMVCLAAAVPSILYYVCLFAQIDSYAARIGLKPPPITVVIPPIWRTLAKNLHIVVSFVVLILVLFFLRLSAEAPWYATGLAIILAMFRKDIRLTPKRLLDLLEEVGRVLGDLMGIMASVGMIIGSFIIAGIAFSLPYEVVGLAGGNVFIMLLLGAVASFILGMGVTISACYIFLAIVLAPGLVDAGFDVMAAHLFVLYCGMMSYITPPVALSAFAAATISGASPMKTGFQAMKLGAAKYILPFVFIFSPALILRAPAAEMLQVIPTVLVALIIISGALEGYFWRLGNLTWLSRGLFLVVGGLMAVPNLTTDLIGIGVFVVIFSLAYLLRGRSPLSKILVYETQP